MNENWRNRDTRLCSGSPALQHRLRAYPFLAFTEVPDFPDTDPQLSLGSRRKENNGKYIIKDSAPLTLRFARPWRQANSDDIPSGLKSPRTIRNYKGFGSVVVGFGSKIHLPDPKPEKKTVES